MIDLNIKHYFSGREYAKQMTLPAGHYAETHKHTHDHLSILASGRVLVTVDGATSAHEGPTCITIPAGAAHRIDAVTDSEWFCVHATSETDPDKIDHQLIEAD